MAKTPTKEAVPYEPSVKAAIDYVTKALEGRGRMELGVFDDGTNSRLDISLFADDGSAKSFVIPSPAKAALADIDAALS